MNSNGTNRDNTYNLLRNAGYYTIEYIPGKELPRPVLSDSGIRAYLIRPQALVMELRSNRLILDAGIGSADWMRECGTQGITKVGNLFYAKGQVVSIVKKESSVENLDDLLKQGPILCASEYVNITRDYIMQNKTYKDKFGSKKPTIVFRGEEYGENPEVKILYSDGKTELYITKGADMVVDFKKTGKTLETLNLRKLDKIMNSQAALYMREDCSDWKKNKIEEFYQNLITNNDWIDEELVTKNTTLKEGQWIYKERFKDELNK
jgi:ATP phosphoribosyltransferase